MGRIIFKMIQSNWSMIKIGDWVRTEWTIYNDLGVDIKKIYKFLANEENDDILHCLITKEQNERLLENIELAKKSDIRVDAYDGTVWEFIQYDNDHEIWKRENGYIYGIDYLEEIAETLYGLTK